ncbi:MAG: redox-regulated ATPase YchF [Pseudomonadota bacterium]
MGFRCGIVGLPNVGKSTLFNALTKSTAADVANYPFCTIDPNIGRVAVPDARLQQLAALNASAVQIPANLDFVDIAGLVRGAAAGEGLGNRFLANIREVDVICHVLRCFASDSITHINGHVDPKSDYETVETELMLADLESLERRQAPLVKKARGGDEQAAAMLDLVQAVLPVLEAGEPARLAPIPPAALRSLQLITSKPVLLIANLDEESIGTGNQFSLVVEELGRKVKAPVLQIAAGIEQELLEITDMDECGELLDGLGIRETGLEQLIFAGYSELGLITFFTAGPKESRAWSVAEGSTAQQAAGVIHTDFARGFIAAEITAYDDYIACKGLGNARQQGKARLEGRDYLIRDGDVVQFRFNV